jgi:hypothetical protein
MVCAAISPANLPMPLRPFALCFFLAVSSPRRWVRSLAMSRYSCRSSVSVIPLPSSSMTIGPWVIGVGREMRTVSASASQALSTSSFSAASEER